MTLTRLNYDPRLVLTGGLGSTIGADGQGADPGPNRIPSPDHDDGIEYEPDDASGGVVIASYDGSDEDAKIGSLADAFSGAGRLPAHVPATSGPPRTWSPPPQGGTSGDFTPSGVSPPATLGHQDLFSPFGGSPSGRLPEPGSPAYGRPHLPPKPRTGDEAA